jgi:hypothetical protein
MIVNVWTIRYCVLKAVELGRVNPSIVFIFTFEYACTHRPRARFPVTVIWLILHTRLTHDGGSRSFPMAPSLRSTDRGRGPPTAHNGNLCSN